MRARESRYLDTSELLSVAGKLHKDQDMAYAEVSTHELTVLLPSARRMTGTGVPCRGVGSLARLGATARPRGWSRRLTRCCWCALGGVFNLQELLGHMDLNKNGQVELNEYIAFVKSLVRRTARRKVSSPHRQSAAVPSDCAPCPAPRLQTEVLTDEEFDTAIHKVGGGAAGGTWDGRL